MSTRTGFAVASGTALGARHRRGDRPNQDAFAVISSAQGIALTVADGCGGQPKSELGAALGARLCARALERRGGEPPASATRLVELALQDTLGQLSTLLRGFSGTRSELVYECLLFTLLGAWVDEDRAVVFAMGDGVVAMNDEVWRIDQQDQPSYLGYALLGQPLPDFRIWTCETPELSHLLLATDGLTDYPRLEELWTDRKNFVHPDALRRRLVLETRETLAVDWDAGRVRREAAALQDDVTAVVLRRDDS